MSATKMILVIHNGALCSITTDGPIDVTVMDYDWFEGGDGKPSDELGTEVETVYHGPAFEVEKEKMFAEWDAKYDELCAETEEMLRDDDDDDDDE